jgi:hypothetical protein
VRERESVVLRESQSVREGGSERERENERKGKRKLVAAGLIHQQRQVSYTGRCRHY